MADLIVLTVKRYKCPHCPRSTSSKASTRKHMARCWRNPDAKGCLTCKHFDNTYEDGSEGCDVGVDLEGRPACADCQGTGFANALRFADDGEKCATCKGDAAEVKPGPIVGCDQWEAK